MCTNRSWVSVTGRYRSPKENVSQDKPTGMGIPSGKHPLVRCPQCSRRLKVRAMYCVGGEFVGWKLPEHAIRVTRSPGPKRKSKISGRGK